MKNWIICFSSLICTATGFSQEIQVNPFANYFLAGKLDGFYADALFDNGPDAGLGLSYGLGKGKHLELSYTFAKSGGILRDNSTDSVIASTDLSFGYIQVGYVQELILSSLPDLRPFGMLTIGAAYINPENPRYLTDWKFAAALGIGLKYFITDIFGFRVQVRLLMPLFFSDTAGNCSTFGCTAGINSFTSLAQGDVGGGIILRFRKED